MHNVAYVFCIYIFRDDFVFQTAEMRSKIFSIYSAMYVHTSVHSYTLNILNYVGTEEMFTIYFNIMSIGTIILTLSKQTNSGIVADKKDIKIMQILNVPSFFY